MTLSYASFSKALNQIISERGDSYCGVPMPLPGLGLELAKDFPLAAEVAKMQEILDGDAPAPSLVPDLEGWQLVNQWRGTGMSGIPANVIVARNSLGQTRAFMEPLAPLRNRFLFGPFDTMDAWNLDTELVAMEKLATLLNERMFKAYVLTGQFLETSKRSGLSYFFRRLRPTIVMSPRGGRRAYLSDGDEGESSMVIVTCLCLHPLAYYKNSFCGAMCPTDDVIAHLMLMRGDEHLFWRRANQHAPSSPNSGL